MSPTTKKRMSQEEFDALPIVKPEDVLPRKLYCARRDMKIIPIPQMFHRSTDGVLRLNGYAVTYFAEIRGPVEPTGAPQ